jgi:hypothetical protein
MAIRSLVNRSGAQARQHPGERSALEVVVFCNQKR